MRTKLALVFVLLLAFSAYGQDDRRHVPVPGAPPLNDELQQLWTRYEQSISDAAVYERWNLRRLRPLVADANGEVLVATLTRVNYTAGESFAPRGDIWVTGVPEVQTICRAFRGDVQMQLRELIGLPPDQDVSHAVVFRAHLSDIFRPSPWPGTNTEWPCQEESAPNCGNSFPADATPAHIQWIATANLALHTVPNGYPWTHLGYTYNWAPGADRYGASEYIISKQAKYPVYVVSNVSPAEYCAPQ